MEILLPLYEWFTAEFDRSTGLGNCWSGSVGTDAKRGGMDRPLFEYSVLIRQDENKVKTFTASHWIRPAWPESLDEKTITSRDFEGTREGLEEVALWLREAGDASGIKG